MSSTADEMATCKHLVQPPNGVTLAGTATVFTCPWCALERLERELVEANAAFRELLLINGRSGERGMALSIALHRYGDHLSECASKIPYEPPRGFQRRPCSCGFDAMISLAAAEHTVVASPAKVTIPEAAARGA